MALPAATPILVALFLRRADRYRESSPRGGDREQAISLVRDTLSLRFRHGDVFCPGHATAKCAGDRDDGWVLKTAYYATAAYRCPLALDASATMALIANVRFFPRLGSRNASSYAPAFNAIGKMFRDIGVYTVLDRRRAYARLSWWTVIDYRAPRCGSPDRAE